MSNIRFQLDLRGLNELMKSREMQKILDDAGTRMAGTAGRGYESEGAHPIGFVAINSVYAGTARAKRDSKKYDTLNKAMGGVKV